MTTPGIGRRALNWARANVMSLDILANTLAGGRNRQSVSKRAALAREKGRAWGCFLCAVLDWIDPGHCDAAKAANEGE